MGFSHGNYALRFAYALSRLVSGPVIVPNRRHQRYKVFSLTPCFFVTSGIGDAAASRRIFTICSSVNRLYCMALAGGHALTFQLVRNSRGRSTSS